ncbi:DUF3592 domain-containing protein [Streptomyces yaanensis]|uniref:DUF3592 domain-containing protein n=1 Tax=Streptomyces yaanensis TaxID=1142239 RepID=A0ABV7SLC2_9ACTN|nr:DUF3592 domain-containing protein [Streptomyces sp. CGMCC 4.7035]WNC02074.1 DUF3592 domain-containing protein [Streptomyces sp. CGMCC 4.7035]
MDQPWLTFSLLIAAFTLGLGAWVLRIAFRRRRALARLGVRGVRTKGEVARGARREGSTTHPPQVRYKAPPLDHRTAPPEQTYRRTPLNHEQQPLQPGAGVILRYDPRDPRRVVVVRTDSGRPGYVFYSATAHLAWGVFFVLFGVAVAVGSFL